MSNSVNLSLDVTKTGIQNPLIKVRQGDGGFETLHATVTANGEPMDLQGWTITFMGTTAGNHKIVDANVTLVEAPNGIFDYTPSKVWGMDVGEFKIAYFKFVKGDGSASSANFRVNVIEAVDLTQEEAKNYISVVNTTIAGISQRLNDSLASVTQSFAATSSTASLLSVKVSSAISQVDSVASNASSVASSTASNASSVASSAVSNINSAASSAASYNDAQFVHKTGTETIDDDKTFTSPINGNLSGNAATATKWQTARTLALTGDVTGSVAMDGSNDVSIATTGANLVHKTGTETIAGDKTFTGKVSIPVVTRTLSGTDGMAFKFRRTGNAVHVGISGNYTGTNWTDSSDPNYAAELFSVDVPAGFAPDDRSQTGIIEYGGAAGFVRYDYDISSKKMAFTYRGMVGRVGDSKWVVSSMVYTTSDAFPG